MAGVVQTRKYISLTQKIVLQQRVHKLEFKERLEDLKRFNCMQCHQMAILNVQLQCSHILCGDCFPKLHLKRCPASFCSMQVTPCEVEDNLFEEALSELKVTCLNRAIGCPEVIPLCNLLAHEDSCHYSQQLNQEAIDLSKYKQQIMDLQNQLADVKMSVMQLQQICGQWFPKLEKEMKEIIVEEIRKESARQHLKLETKVEKIIWYTVDNKIDLLENKVANMLHLKQEEQFQTVEDRMWTRLEENCEVIQERALKDAKEKLHGDVNRLKTDLEGDLRILTKDIEKLLEEKSKASIQEVLDVKCPEMELRSLKEMGVFQRNIEAILRSNLETDFQILEKRTWTQLHDNCDVIQETVAKNAMQKVAKDTHGFQKGLESDLLNKSNEIKKLLLEESKGFIEEVLDVKCLEMEKRSFDNLIGSLKEHLQEMLSDIKFELNDDIRGYLATESKELLDYLKDEMDFKCKEQDEILRDLGKLFMENCERKERQIKSDVVGALYYFQLNNDATSLSQAFSHLLPRSKTLTWDIGNFKDGINDRPLVIKSDIFHFPEFGCQLRFSLQPDVRQRIQVEYVKRRKAEVNSLSGHHRITFTLKDQLEDKNYKDVVQIFEPAFQNWRTSTVSEVPYLTNDELTLVPSRWLEDGKIQMRVTLEPLIHLVATEPPMYGSLIWRIDHFADVYESFSYGRQCAWSESFYSSRKGPWDKDLPKKFYHRTTLSVVSQDDNGWLKDRTISKESDSVKWDEFTDTIEEVELRDYVKNDSLVISFKIEPLSCL